MRQRGVLMGDHTAGALSTARGHTLSLGTGDKLTLFGAYIKANGGFTTLLDGYPKLRDAQALCGFELPVPDDVL